MKMNCCGPGMKMHLQRNDKSFGEYGKYGLDHWNSNQKVDNGNLTITMLAPGIIKDTLKIRAKADKMTVQAQKKSEIYDLIGEKDYNVVISLEEEIMPDSAKAKYIDGVLNITFSIANPGYEVSNVNYE